MGWGPFGNTVRTRAPLPRRTRILSRPDPRFWARQASKARWVPPPGWSPWPLQLQGAGRVGSPRPGCVPRSRPQVEVSGGPDRAQTRALTRAAGWKLEPGPRARTHRQRGRPGWKQDRRRGGTAGRLSTTRPTNPQNKHTRPVLASHGLSPLWAGPPEHCG